MSTSRRRSSRPPHCRYRQTCRDAACCRSSADERPPTGGRRCTPPTTPTRAITTPGHITVRTATHKLIYFWKKDQWELFDLVNDPHELHNLYGLPGHEAVTAELKTELLRLKKSLKDDDQFANDQLPNGVDGPVARLRGK